MSVYDKKDNYPYLRIQQKERFVANQLEMEDTVFSPNDNLIRMETQIQTDNCIFCNIVNNKAPSEKIYEDNYVTCIKDINPASTHHYLILPNKHIRNAKELQPEDAELYDRIVSTVDVILEKQHLDPAVTRTGFHWPPFNTVPHLHLHVISPVCNINFIKRIMFQPNSYWFVSTDYVKSRLKACK